MCFSRESEVVNCRLQVTQEYLELEMSLVKLNCRIGAVSLALLSARFSARLAPFYSFVLTLCVTRICLSITHRCPKDWCQISQLEFPEGPGRASVIVGLSEEFTSGCAVIAVNPFP